MPQYWHVETVLGAKSGLTRDNVVNNWAFHTDEASATSFLADVIPGLTAFYNTAPTGEAHPLAYLIGKHVSRTADACVHKVYDIGGHLDGSPAGSPAAIAPFTLAAASTDAQLPAEVAICLSFHSSYGVAAEFGDHLRPRARLRGRVYIGPLIADTTALQPLSEDAGTGIVRVGSGARTLITKAADELRQGLHYAGGPDTNATWSTWSRAASLTHPVAEVWVDDAFDTVRRRGPRPTTKTILPEPV